MIAIRTNMWKGGIMHCTAMYEEDGKCHYTYLLTELLHQQQQLKAPTICLISEQKPKRIQLGKFLSL